MRFCLLFATGWTGTYRRAFGCAKEAARKHLHYRALTVPLRRSPLNYNATNDFASSIFCRLNTAADVEDNFDEKTGVGTFKVTIGKNDGCFESDTGAPAVPFSNEHFFDRGVTFDLYHGSGASIIVSTASAILDNGGNTLNVANVAGSLAPIHSNGP